VTTFNKTTQSQYVRRSTCYVARFIGQVKELSEPRSYGVMRLPHPCQFSIPLSFEIWVLA
jgi:hypothetical protein